MKKKLLIAILIIILLGVYYFLGTDYAKQRQQNAELTSQITKITQTLAQMPEPPQDMEQQLAATQASLTAEQSAFPGKMNSTNIVNIILKLADDHEVKAVPMVTQPWSIEVVGGHDYYVFRLNVAATANFSQLVSFVSKLENGELETLTIEDLSVTRQPAEESIPDGAIPVTASLNLAVFAQVPAPD